MTLKTMTTLAADTVAAAAAATARQAERSLDPPVHVSRAPKRA